MRGTVILMLMAVGLFPDLSAGERAAPQSELRLYGRIDLNVTRYRNSNGIPTVTSGIWSGSRLGLKGNGDLGSGLKPLFRLESGFGTKDGDLQLMQGGRLFGRQAYVGLESGLGTVTAGRLYPASDPVVDMVDIALPGVLSSYKSQFYWQIGRLEKALLYTSPDMGGLQARLGYAFGDKAGAFGASTLTSGLMYKTGGLTAGVSLESWKTSAFGASSAVYNFWNLAASYDWKVAALVVGFSSDDVNQDLSALNAIKSRTYAVGATLPTGAAGKVVSLLQVIKPDHAAAMHIGTLRYAHSLSRRASLYSQINLADRRAAETYARKSEFIFGVHYQFDVLLWGH